jgi:biofilm PGA synthesis N-glycosyltransferase PgaC
MTSWDPQAVVDALQRFEFVYPFVMAGVWVAGALFFWWFEERGAPSSIDPPLPGSWPRAAVIVPCHNEAPR